MCVCVCVHIHNAALAQGIMDADKSQDLQGPHWRHRCSSSPKAAMLQPQQGQIFQPKGRGHVMFQLEVKGGEFPRIQERVSCFVLLRPLLDG